MHVIYVLLFITLMQYGVRAASMAKAVIRQAVTAEGRITPQVNP